MTLEKEPSAATKITILSQALSTFLEHRLEIMGALKQFNCPDDIRLELYQAFDKIDLALDGLDEDEIEN